MLVSAIHGYNFWKSGVRGFEVLTSHALKLATVSSVGWFTMVLGQVVITAFVFIIGMPLLWVGKMMTKEYLNIDQWFLLFTFCLILISS